MKIVARVFSNLFVPPATAMFICIFMAIFTEDTTGDKWTAAISGIMFGFVLPVAFFLHLRRIGIVGDVDVTNKDERTLPYLSAIVVSILGFVFTRYMQNDFYIQSFWLISAVNTVFLLTINKYWKISAHAVGNAGPAMLVFLITGARFWWILLIFFSILWSRLYLKKHTPLQLVAGTVLGFVSTYAQIEIYRMIL